MNGCTSCEELSGTWKLIEIRGDMAATFGKTPQGLFAFGRDGQALVLITAEKRPQISDLSKMTDQERAALFKTMLAYGGTYTFDGKEVRIKVGISWNENWTGTELVRFAKFERNKLELSTPVYPSTVDGKPTTTVLVWQKLF